MPVDKKHMMQLRAAMEVWLPGRSQSVLARMAGTSPATVKRVIQNEVLPEEGTALRIAHVVMSGAEFQSFAVSVSPQLQKSLPSFYPASSETLTQALQRPEYIKVITLATGLDGTDEDEVKRKFGQNYLAYFTDLCNANVLEKKGERWFLGTSDVSALSLETSRTVISTFAKMADRENDSIPNGSIAYTICETVKPDVFLEFCKKATEFNSWAFKILSDPKNRGDVLLTYGLILNAIKGQEHLQ